MIEQSIQEQIKKVCSLKAGWLDGDGDEITTDPDFLFEVIQALRHDGLFETVGIYPTVDGSVQLEWDHGDDVRTLIVE